MEINLKRTIAALFITGCVGTAHASICNIVPGSVTCKSGTIPTLTGSGMVSINGTTITGGTQVNGLLNAEDANFSSLDVNGSAKLVQCTINEAATIKGSLSASSTKFGNTVDIYSSETRFINSKVSNDLHIGHTDAKKQVVYLDNFSEVLGNIIFDDGNGEVIIRGKSKIGGKVIGGHTIIQ